MCDGIQHINKNNEVCIFTSCIKCQNIIFNLEKDKFNNDIEIYGYPKTEILFMIDEKIKNIKKERLPINKRKIFKDLLKLLSYDYSVKLINDHDQLRICIKNRILNFHSYDFDCTKYFKYIFNEDISDYID